MVFFVAVVCVIVVLFFFFFNDTATPEIYTLSLHDALPISSRHSPLYRLRQGNLVRQPVRQLGLDRKSTRLNSSHLGISYAVFCLKKKMNTSLKGQNEATGGCRFANARY